MVMVMNMARHYKIQRKSDGLFSNGGSNPKFTKYGKIWRSAGQLKNHLSLVGCYKTPISKVYEGCELVTLEFHEVETVLSLSEIIDNIEKDQIISVMKGK